MKIIPSLNFEGNAEEAMNFYKEVFEADITGIMRYKDMPGYEKKPETENKVLRGELMFNFKRLSFTDYFGEGGVKPGNQVEIIIDCDSEDQVKLFFHAIKEDAMSITMEPQETFWGSFYAQLIDKYGIGWSFNYQKTPVEYPKG